MSCLGDSEPVTKSDSSDQVFHRSNQTALLIDLTQENTDKRSQGVATIQDNHVMSVLA